MQASAPKGMEKKGISHECEIQIDKSVPITAEQYEARLGMPNSDPRDRFVYLYLIKCKIFIVLVLSMLLYLVKPMGVKPSMVVVFCKSPLIKFQAGQ